MTLLNIPVIKLISSMNIDVNR